MKLAALPVSLLLLLTACSQSTPPAQKESGDTATASAPVTASATGTVEAVDPAARTVTIAHGPVEALHWPSMTMTYQAGSVDLGPIKKGDRVSFRFTAAGMDGTLVSIRPIE